MKQKILEKLTSVYMGDVGMPKLDRVNVRRAIKNAFLDGLETACKGIKPLDWEVARCEMLASTFVGLFVIKPLLKGRFDVDCNGKTLCTRLTLSKAKEFANKIYKEKVKEKLGL